MESSLRTVNTEEPTKAKLCGVRPIEMRPAWLQFENLGRGAYLEVAQALLEPLARLESHRFS